MADETKSEFASDLGLQAFDLRATELDDLARDHVDQVVMVFLARVLVTVAPVEESVALKDASLLEAFQGPVHRGQRDARVVPDHPPVQFWHVGMSLRTGEHFRDQLALTGQLDTAITTGSFDAVCHLESCANVTIRLIGTQKCTAACLRNAEHAAPLFRATHRRVEFFGWALTGP